jgi:HK97 family phage major capsid protein
MRLTLGDTPLLIERKTGLERGPAIPLERKDTVTMTPEMKKLFEDLQDGFKAYRTKQEQRYDDLKRRLDEAELSAKRPIVKSVGARPPELPKGWDDYLRKGHTAGIEEKALSVGSNPDGGYTVPEVLANRIIEVARNRSNIRAISASVRIEAGSAFEIVADPNDFESAWVSEAGSRLGTNSAKLAKIVIPVHEQYAMPKATQTLLDDSQINIEEWLSNRIADLLSREENATFVNGDGVGKPQGFLSYPTVANASWAWGSIGYHATGQADFSADPDGADDFIDTVYGLKADYRANASWVMNSLTASKVRKFKDSNAPARLPCGDRRRYAERG